MVTGTKEKETIWKQNYQLPDNCIYNYENFDTIAANDAVDIVYVVLPNSMHADFCIRAAKAGKHVICEKPMAMDVAECDAIIDACKAQGVKLGMGYRMQSDPHTHEVKRLVREKTYGDILVVASDAAYISKGNPGQWRLDRSLSGGGALVNMGYIPSRPVFMGQGKTRVRSAHRNSVRVPNISRIPMRPLPLSSSSERRRGPYDDLAQRQWQPHEMPWQ